MKHSILIADDHKLFRRAVKGLLRRSAYDFNVLEASNGDDTIAILENGTVDVMLLDVNMPGLTGLDVLVRMQTMNTTVKVIVFTLLDDVSLINHVIQLGAHGFLLKDTEPKQLLTAIDEVIKNGIFSDARTENALTFAKSFPGFVANLSLTPREKKLLLLIASGKTNGEMAHQLGLGVYTIESYRKSLMEKTNTKNVAELIYFAMKSGLLR